MSDNAIEVQNLTKRYGQTTVVRGISFSVRRGKFLGSLVQSLIVFLALYFLFLCLSWVLAVRVTKPKTVEQQAS